MSPQRVLLTTLGVSHAMNEYPTLCQFFGGYMHQDWRDDYPDEWAALDDFWKTDPRR
jgi:hypothetical protein